MKPPAGSVVVVVGLALVCVELALVVALPIAQELVLVEAWADSVKLQKVSV